MMVIKSQPEHKAGDALGRGYKVIYRLLPLPTDIYRVHSTFGSVKVTLK